MNNLFPFHLGAGFASAGVHSVQSVRCQYVRFLNLELKSDFHFLYVATIFRQHHQPLALVLAVMRAQFFLYVFARIYKRICACRTVSLRETRTTVCEWACCNIILKMFFFFFLLFLHTNLAYCILQPLKLHKPL